MSSTHHQATSTRFTGLCPACQRQVKARDGKLVHHGYQRPGAGYIVGDCFGVGYEPHEISPKCAEDLKTLVTLRLGNEREALRHAPTKTTALDVHALEQELVRLDGLLTNWSPRPLFTLEEEIAQKRDAKIVRDIEKQARQDAKIANLVAGFRQRLESASRRRTASVFITIFEGAPSKLSDAAGGMTRKAAYEAIGHIDVWQKLGLLTEAGEPVYSEVRGRYKDYSIPYSVRSHIEANIKAGAIELLVF